MFLGPSATVFRSVPLIHTTCPRHLSQCVRVGHGSPPCFAGTVRLVPVGFRNPWLRVPLRVPADVIADVFCLPRLLKMELEQRLLLVMGQPLFLLLA